MQLPPFFNFGILIYLNLPKPWGYHGSLGQGTVPSFSGPLSFIDALDALFEVKHTFTHRSAGWDRVKKINGPQSTST
jgi:hypothetical protein